MMKKTKTGRYEAPEIRTEVVRVEQGFAQTGGYRDGGDAFGTDDGYGDGGDVF